MNFAFIEKTYYKTVEKWFLTSDQRQQWKFAKIEENLQDLQFLGITVILTLRLSVIMPYFILVAKKYKEHFDFFDLILTIRL